MRSSLTRNRMLQPATGLLLACVVCLQCHQSVQPLVDVTVVGASAGTASTASYVPSPSAGGLVELASRDPVAFLRLCRERYRFRDYTCTFIKQEFISNSLTKPQEIAVRCREEPFSVDMQWIKNPAQAKRALYVENAWKDRKGRELAWFRPAGAIIKFFIPKIRQPIAGRHAKAASRRSLDQFGFSRTLDLIIKYVERGRENDVLELHYAGEGSIEGRPTFVFERYLPYTGQEEPYPDSLLRYHIDQEWLIPSACFSYSDRNGERLLGSYVMTNIQFNVGLSDDDFDPDKINF